MRNYAETCKVICGYNLIYNFFVYFLPVKSSLLWCTFQTHFSMGRRRFPNMILRLKYFLSFFLWFDLAYIGVWVFRFYKIILHLKTRLQEQNLKKARIFFSLSFKSVHLLQNWIEKKFIFYRVRLFHRMIFFTEWIFLNRINVFERGYRYLF